MEKAALQSVSAALHAHLRARARAGVRWVYPGSAPLPEAASDPLPLAPAADAPRQAPDPASGRAPDRAALLAAIRDEMGDCTRCKLHAGRKNLVFGVGNPDARLMFVGEGPGRDEDEQGEPFVGAAGQLLTKIIEAIGLDRSDVYIANVVKSRPPNNRNPEPDEIAACLPFLEKQIDAIGPKVLVALGNVAAKTLLKTDTGIMKLRGSWREYRGIPLMPTFHPAYLLRNAEDKRLVWEDMLKVADRYNEDLPPGVKPARPKTKGQ